MVHRPLTVNRPIKHYRRLRFQPFLARSQATWTRSPDSSAHGKPKSPDSLLPVRAPSQRFRPPVLVRAAAAWGNGRENARAQNRHASPNAIHATRKRQRRRPGGGSQEVNDGSAATQNRSPRKQMVEPDYLRVSGRRFGRLRGSGVAGRRPHSRIKARCLADRQEIIRGSSAWLEDAGFMFWMNWKMRSNGLEMQVLRRLWARERTQRRCLHESRSSRHVKEDESIFVALCWSSCPGLIGFFFFSSCATIKIQWSCVTEVLSKSCLLHAMFFLIWHTCL